MLLTGVVGLVSVGSFSVVTFGVVTFSVVTFNFATLCAITRVAASLTCLPRGCLGRPRQIYSGSCPASVTWQGGAWGHKGMWARQIELCSVYNGSIN